MSSKYIEIYDLVQASPDNYLIHHGIKGMKWGIRRYQNPDGSYTAAGKSRYSKAANAVQRDADDLRVHGYKAEAAAVQKVADRVREKAKAKEEKIQSRIDNTEKTKKAFTLNQKVSQMSEEELRARIARLQLENLYKREYVYSKQGASFIKRNGMYLQDLVAAGNNVSQLAKLGSRALKLAKHLV